MGLSATSGAALSAALLAATVLGGCMKTATYGTGESPEVAIFREVTGGLVGGEKEQAVYQPRAPLVLPPSAGAQLPAPAPATEATVAQWPDDPDEDSDTAAAPGAEPGVSQAEYRRLRPLGAVARAPRPQRERTHDDFRMYDLVHERQQRKTFEAALKDANGISQERRYLTDPPDTVREPAATAPQQFDEIEKKKKGNFLTRIFTRG